MEMVPFILDMLVLTIYRHRGRISSDLLGCGKTRYEYQVERLLSVSLSRPLQNCNGRSLTPGLCPAVVETETMMFRPPDSLAHGAYRGYLGLYSSVSMPWFICSDEMDKGRRSLRLLFIKPSRLLSQAPPLYCSGARSLTMRELIKYRLAASISLRPAGGRW